MEVGLSFLLVMCLISVCYVGTIFVGFKLLTGRWY